jgi:hypothetical protein
MPAPKQALAVLAIGVWAVAIGIGFAVLGRYESTPGAAGGPPARWPSASAIDRPAGRPTLLMFAHPQCVCTRASLGELARMTGRFRDLAVYVVFMRPSDGGAEWDESDLWERAVHTPGVGAVRDPDGVEATRFGVITSGHALLYDASGRLAFSGGLTAARGREGEGPGGRRLAVVLTTGKPDQDQGPVFGCALR